MRWGLLGVLLLLVGGSLAFVFLGGEPAPNTPVGDGTSDVRLPAGAALTGRGRPLAEAPVATLLDELVDDEGELVEEAARALRARGRRDPGLASSLVARIQELLGRRDPWQDMKELLRLYRALVVLGEDGARAFLALIDDPDERSWSYSIPFAAGFGADIGPLMPTLLTQAEAMHAESSNRLFTLLLAFQRIGPGAASARPLLVSLLEPPLQDTFVGHAANALLAICGPSEETFSVLRGVLADPDTEARPQVIAELGQLGAEASSFVPAFVDLLQDPEPATRATAARALGKIGVVTPDVIRELAFFLQDDQGKATAAYALATLGQDGLRVLLDSARTAERIETRVRSLQAYLTTGGDIQEALPILVDILEADVERGWKVQALSTLGWISPLPDSPALVELLASAADDPVLYSTAYPLLVKLPGGAGEAVVEAHALEATTPEQRLVATESLLYTQEPQPVAASALLGLVREDFGRQTLQRVLGHFQRVDPPVRVADGLAPLRARLTDEDRFVRYAALQATLALAGDRAALIDIYVECLDDVALRPVAAGGLAMDTAMAERVLPALIARAGRDVQAYGYVAGDVSAAIVKLAPHWSGTKPALRALADSLTGKTKATLQAFTDAL